MYLQYHLIIYLFTLLTCWPDSRSTKLPVRHITETLAITVWYGSEQHFGKLGVPQRWVNILGNVHAPKGLQTLTYTLNHGTAVTLSAGRDDCRLANKGDFNIDIDTALLQVGKNLVMIAATDSLGNKATKVVQLYYEKDNLWPLPYTIKWKNIKSVTDAVQVVDGHWTLEGDGIRTQDPYYDRVLAFGDHTWKDYEVSTSVIFHGFTPPTHGPPTYNVSHAAIATRWLGHDRDDRQPHVKWYPLGAIAEYRLSKNLDSCSWRIFDAEHLYVEGSIGVKSIRLGTRYHLKHRVETLPDGSTRYQVKLWDDRQVEPDEWDLQATEPQGNIPSGSALLVAHNTDVTFGDVEVIPLARSD